MNTNVWKYTVYFIFTTFNISYGIYCFKNYTHKLINYTNQEENYFQNLIFVLIGFFSSFFMKVFFGKNLIKKMFTILFKNDSNLSKYNFEYLGEKVYLFILYSFSIISFTIFGKNTYYIPKLFGGLNDDNINYLEKNIYFEIPNLGLLFIFYFMLGHHIFRTINHTIYGKSEVVILTIHHHVTIYLMIFTFSFRYYLFGTKISFCHDFTDIFINLAKFLNEIKKSKSLNWVAVFLFFSSWLYFRDYLFNYKIYYQVFYFQYISSEIKNRFIRDLIFKLFLLTFSVLSLLVIINVVWTFRILKLLQKEFLGNKKKIKNK